MAEEDLELLSDRTTVSPPSPLAFLVATAAGLPRPFWVLFAGTIVNRLGQFVEPFLALYLVRGRSLSLTTAGRS